MNEWKFMAVMIGLLLSSQAAAVVVGEYHVDTLSYIVEPEDAKRLMTAQPFRGSTIAKPLPPIAAYKLEVDKSKTWFKRQNQPTRIDRPTPYSKRHSTTKGLIPKSEKRIQQEDLSFLASAPKVEVDYEDLFRSLPGGGKYLKGSAHKIIRSTAHSPRPAGGRVRRSVGRHHYSTYETMMHARAAKKKLALEREKKWRQYEWRDLQSEGLTDLAEQVQQEIEALSQLDELPTNVESPMDEDTEVENADETTEDSSTTDTEETESETQEESTSDTENSENPDVTNESPPEPDTSENSSGLHIQ